MCKKKEFYRNLNKYKRNPSDENRAFMVEACKNYKRLTNQRQADYERQQTRKLLDARLNNIRLYWRMLSGPARKDKVI